jgi:hypothetical protein
MDDMGFSVFSIKEFAETGEHFGDFFEFRETGH